MVGEGARLMWLLRLALGGLGWLRDLVAALVRWLFADWRNAPLLLFAIGFAAHAFLITPELRAERDAAKAAHAAEVEAHNGTIAEFVMATREAERRQAANVARVEAEQAAITRRIEHDYQTKLVALRARADALAGAVSKRMHGAAPKAPKIDPGAPGTARLPGAGAATGLAGEAPGSDGFSFERRLIASEQALQLDALIDWVLAQASVKTSPVPVAEPAP
jgi:signal transduction histidine kinase